jgi:hypothetical protein
VCVFLLLSSSFPPSAVEQHFDTYILNPLSKFQKFKREREKEGDE